jgi:hypothetical protein
MGGAPSRDTWMVRNNCKLLWHIVQLAAIGFLWKDRCKVTFNEVPHPITLGELRRLERVDFALESEPQCIPL